MWTLKEAQAARVRVRPDFLCMISDAEFGMGPSAWQHVVPQGPVTCSLTWGPLLTGSKQPEQQGRRFSADDCGLWHAALHPAVRGAPLPRAAQESWGSAPWTLLWMIMDADVYQHAACRLAA